MLYSLNTFYSKILMILIMPILFSNCADREHTNPLDPATRFDSDDRSVNSSGFSRFHSDFALQNHKPVSSDSRLRESKEEKNSISKKDQSKNVNKFCSEMDILGHYAPIFIHYRAHCPQFDELCRIDYDNDFNASNNVKRSNYFNRKAFIYGQVLAETEDAYYLLYVLYHLRDYDTGFREFFMSSCSHDNDLEGLVLMVSKSDGVIAAETWYHSILLQFTIDKPTTRGTAVIDGKLHLENNQRPYILVQSRGHGVRAIQSLDLNSDEYDNATIYRYKGKAETIDSNKRIIGYDILDFTVLYETALKGTNETFSEYRPFLGSQVHLPLFLAGNFSGNSSWARPKPPWNWNSKLEEITGGALYFHPAYVFNKHYGTNASIKYVKNIPISNAFRQQSDAVLYQLKFKADNWFIEDHEKYLGPQPGIVKQWYCKRKKDLGKFIQWFIFKLG